MTELTPFQLSRVYASGWSAGMGVTAEESTTTAMAQAERLNPQRSPTGRARWLEGFTAALNRRAGRPASSADSD
jgi:hypothetical protein